ncbi:hypothetical protein [Sinorhizobium meliloti]|uniref:hypothetical protein n=1 Tax=Rhizobium meliloti TaxID=382 RepID=UPI0013E2A196|nr:hypothetical protein [Sinorhizobium meliloti]
MRANLLALRDLIGVIAVVAFINWLSGIPNPPKTEVLALSLALAALVRLYRGKA